MREKEEILSALRTVVVVPTYNERENVRPLIEKLALLRTPPLEDLHVLFVDDGSPDGTAEEIEAVMKQGDYIHILRRAAKRGLGTAYLEGFRHAIDTLHPSVFVQMDADLQHPPETIKPLVEAVLGGADVAVGSRRIPGGSFQGLKGRRKLVSWGANWLARNLLGLSVHDPTTGFKALTREAAETLLHVKMHSTGFIYQVESLYIFKQNGLKMTEVPMVFGLRERGSSKMSDREVREFFKSVISMRFRDYKDRRGRDG